MAMLELLEGHSALTCIGVLLLLYLTYAMSTTKPLRLPDLPWIGGKSANKLTLFSNGHRWLTEGYQKFSKDAKTYIFPDITGINHIVLPNERAQWVFDHPDHELSVGAAHYDMLAGDVAFTDPAVLRLLYHEHVIHRNLARKLKDIIPHIWDEVGSSFDHVWGTDTENWKEIVVYESVMGMVSRISNRMFVGFPLCRNDDFLSSMASFAQDVINCVILNQLLPKFVKTILWPVLSLPNRWHYWQGSKYTLPIIKQRIKDIEEKERNPNSKVDIPEDYFTWHIRLAKAEGKTKEQTPDFISRALLAIEFAALHTTTISGTNLLFDLISADPSQGFLAGIQEEAERALSETNGIWTKQTLNKLVRADSALRETMRSTDIIPLVSRKVVAPHGVRDENAGWTAPFGSWISLNATNRHHDPEIYPDPESYDAFRFSRPREAYEASHKSEKQNAEYLKLQNTSFTSTSEDFLPFGHGRHACPGRFFVQQELKMILVYMVLNYEIEHLPQRPPKKLFGMTPIPPTTAKIRVRRKARAAGLS